MFKLLKYLSLGIFIGQIFVVVFNSEVFVEHFQENITLVLIAIGLGVISKDE